MDAHFHTAEDIAFSKPASNDVQALYHAAYKKFGPMALWSSKEHQHPTVGDALAITHSLRMEGNLEARLLAEQIERSCRASD